MDIRYKSLVLITTLVTGTTIGCLFALKEDPNLWVSLSMDNMFKERYVEEGTIGRTYKDHLSSVYSRSNLGFWRDSFDLFKRDREHKRDTLHNIFLDIHISKDRSVYDEDAFNKVCEKIYSKKTSEINGNEDIKQKLKNNLWKYCSPARGDIVKASTRKHSTKYWGDKLGEKLIDAVGTENDGYWIAKNNWFIHQIEPSDPYFQVSWNKAKEDLSDRFSLKKICGNAYSNMMFRPVNTKNPSEKALLTYCSVPEEPTVSNKQ